MTHTLPSAVPAAAPAAALLHSIREVATSPLLAKYAAAADWFPVTADCGHVTDYGQAIPTACGLWLCGEDAATHRCHDDDIAARDGGED